MGLCSLTDRKAKGTYNSKSNKPRRSLYENPDIKKDIIYEINNLRAYHQVPEITESSELDNIAQSFSNKLAKIGDLRYSETKYNGEPLGEILFYYGGECTADSVVETWNKDSKTFRYNSRNPQASSFAQIVWKSTRYIGLGLSKDSQGGTYIVANFYPCGNVIGKFQENVFPPKGRFQKAPRAKSRDAPLRSKANKAEKIDTSSNKKRRNSAEKFCGYNNFIAECLQSHNKYRAKHHSPPLRLNKDLCKIAQSYADRLLATKTFQHSTNKYKGKDLGENLFMVNGKPATGEMATADWYSEIKMYNFRKDYQKGTGHFTQLVWKDTTDVGFGIAYKNDLYYVVANYFPAGNFLGKFSVNVLRA